MGVVGHRIWWEVGRGTPEPWAPAGSVAYRKVNLGLYILSPLRLQGF